MNINFELILTLLTFISGLIALSDVVFFAKRRREKNIRKMSWLIEYSRSFFPVLLIVLILRSFLFEPFRIPSGSDEPTLLVGDFIVVNKFDYGIRLPVLHNKIVAYHEPKTGDMIVFYYPIDPSEYFIKRVIGVPGDKISYINKVLYINGQIAPQTLLGQAVDHDSGMGQSWPVTLKEENLQGIKHQIYLRDDVPPQDFFVVVPANEYFVMGDNRDSSNDSRYWGFMPEKNLVGKATAIWLSWDGENNQVRWSRMGTLIH